MPGIASAATAVLIGHVAGGTSTIRVGAGGIMLPNHSPLVIAEQFGTLESLYPAASIWAWAARRVPISSRRARCAATWPRTRDEFPSDVQELADYFSGEPRPGGPRGTRDRARRAAVDPGFEPVRCAGCRRAWAAVCVRLAFRARANDGRRSQCTGASFSLPRNLAKPYVMLGFNVVAADSIDGSKFLATSMQQAFVNLRSGRPSHYRRPLRGTSSTWGRRSERCSIRCCRVLHRLSRDGARGLGTFIERTGADELIITSQIFDHAARLHSFEIAAKAFTDAPLNRIG